MGPLNPHLRDVLGEVPPYRPGRMAERGGYKLSSNENPYPPLPSVRRAISRAAGSINRYPDFEARLLVEAIADHARVPADMVATGTGAVGVLQQVVQSTCEPGDEVVFAWRSFESYPTLTRIAGARPVPVPLDSGEQHDLDAMADAITQHTRLILLCTPNNPTGPLLRRVELERFLQRVPPDVLVVLDEAYREFVRDPGAPDGVELCRSRANVAVVRTFSKAYGLAGLRVGYAIADERVADAVRRTAVPFGVNALAQTAAIASLKAEAELVERVEAIIAERRRVVAELRGGGWAVPETQANFVWLRLGGRTAEFTDKCEKAGVMVRAFPGEGVRVTIAEPAANDQFLSVARTLAVNTFAAPNTRKCSQPATRGRAGI